MSKQIERVDILQDIFDNFLMVAQEPCEQVSEYLHKAEALIEVLEVADCGSVGGFDSDNPLHSWEYKVGEGKDLSRNICGFPLWNRFRCVLAKHSNKEDVKDICDYFSVEKLGNYFQVMLGLREKFH